MGGSVSLPMRGEWIEIEVLPGCVQPGVGSLPMRGEWIEMHGGAGRGLRHASLPMRGEWIEILCQRSPRSMDCSLSPCGESGLKCQGRFLGRAGSRSLPMRGEWIEISSAVGESIQTVSLPMRGEWIEMPSTTRPDGCYSLSPCGESGLKFIIRCNDGSRERVSPHAGRVD